MKKYIFKLTLISAFVLLAVVCISWIYYVYVKYNIRNHYEELYTVSLNNSASRFDEKIEEGFDALAYSQSNNIIPVNYYSYGTLDENKNMVFATGNGTTNVEISQKVYDGIALYDKNVSRLSLNGIDTILFSSKTDDGYNILSEDYDVFINYITVYEFDNVILCNDNDIVIANSANKNIANIFDIMNSDNYEELSGGDNIYASFEGEEKLFFKKNLPGSNFYTVGYISGEKINAFVSDDLRKSVIFIFAVGLCSFIGAFVLILILIIANNRNLVGNFSRGKYCIFINGYGKILAKNKMFRKQFECSDILSSIIDDNEKLKQDLSKNSDVILLFKSREGKKVYIKFLSSQSLSGFRMVGTDITEKMEELYAAKYLANCDNLTNLPNLKQLYIDYEAATTNDKDEKFSVTLVEMLNLEKYRVMFGNFMHKTIKIKFAGRMNELFKDMVYHYDENRFIIFTHNDSDTDFMKFGIDKYLPLLNSPFNFEEQCLKIDFKAGQSKIFYGKEKLDIDLFVKQAKQALQSVKMSPVKVIGVFYDALLKNDITVFEDKKAIIDLLNNNLLTLYFQPQYSLKDEKIVGFEALTRITKKVNITISEFIEIAEQNGSIIELGKFVYKSAMTFAKEIQKYNVSISLNVSPVQLMQEGFVENFLTEYRKYNLRKHSIAVEITESFLMSSYEGVITKLNILQEEGIDVHLDDFGVAYSSMLYLKKLPIRAIKIDKEFIRDITENNYSNAIADTIITLTSQLGLICIAEGVETKEQVNLLKTLDCDIIQGYYISKAVPPLEAEELIIKYNNKGLNK